MPSPFDLMKDKLSLEIGKLSRSEALSKNKCQNCAQDITGFKDDASRREYNLTAWCQSCQDLFFG